MYKKKYLENINSIIYYAISSTIFNVTSKLKIIVYISQTFSQER